MNISLTFVRILFCTNQDAKAWKYIEISIINASYVGERFHVARALEYMGYGYLRRGDYQNAYGAYEASAEKDFGSRFVNLKLCEENMDRIKRKQRNPDTVIGFHRPHGDFDETLLYHPVFPSISTESPVSHS